jgi:two-component system sensor histidine kinase/response regulator
MASQQRCEPYCLPQPIYDMPRQNTASVAQAPAEAGVDGLPAGLLTIPGLQVVQSFKLVGSPLFKLLRRYALEHGGDMARVREYMLAGDREAARRVVHTLKGISGNLGATRVHHLASELVAELTAGADSEQIEAKLKMTETELSTLVSALLESIPEETSADSTVVDWVKVGQVMLDLEPLLEISAVDANLIFEQNAALLKTALGPLGAQLERALDSFLYPEALDCLRQIYRDRPELGIQK